MGKLIVLTGLDGSGTSSVSAELQKLDAGSKLFNGVSDPYLMCREKIDKATRTASPIAHYLFYLSANIYTSSLIEEALKSGNVYCVRHLIDTVVSHRVAGLSVDLIYETSLYRIRKPDLIVFLSVKEEVRQERLNRRGKGYLDHTLDDNSFREKLLKEFSKLSEYFTTVNVSEKNVLQVVEEIRLLIRAL